MARSRWDRNAPLAGRPVLAGLTLAQRSRWRETEGKPADETLTKFLLLERRTTRQNFCSIE
jgi:hypothetical protein